MFMGRSSDFRIVLLTTPSHSIRTVVIVAFVPVTAAGPRRTFTVFPIYSLLRLPMYSAAL